MNPTLNAPGTKLLKLKYDKLLPSFAFNVNLRRYSVASPPPNPPPIPSSPSPPPNPIVKIKEYSPPPPPNPSPPPPFPPPLVLGRGLHSSTFLLNLSAACGIGVR